MKARKLRSLVRSGELRGYQHGRDLFVAASELRAFIQGRPVEPTRPIVVREPLNDRSQDLGDDLSVELGIAPKDPVERRAFEARLARRRAEGGERVATLQAAEDRRRQSDERAKRQQDRAAKRAEKKKRP